MSPKIFEFFPGGNTPKGFFSYYDNVLPQSRAKRILTIKGGPGTGKSTLMKGIAAKLLPKGYDCELLHCSSDKNSLDGIVFPQLGCCVLDGTSPHIVDPKNPAAVDDILNFGEFWDSEKIKSQKENIISCNAQIKAYFSRAYRYLGAAEKINQDINALYSPLFDKSCIKTEFKKMLFMFDGIEDNKTLGWCRKLFLTAITPTGLTSYAHTYLVNAKKVYCIYSYKNPYSGELLKKISDYACELGLETHAFYCPFAPDKKIEHLYIPKPGIFITTVNDYIKPDISADMQVIDLDKYQAKSLTNDSEISLSKSTFNNLLFEAINNINKAKTLHDKLEGYYIPYMDFEKKEKLEDQIAEKFLNEA